MISRRVIRTKVMQILYAYNCSPEKSINNAEKELFFSLNKSYDLYHLLLQLLVDIHSFAAARIEQVKQRKITTSEGLNPNTNFIDNALLIQLASNEQLRKHIDKNKLTWVNYPEIIRNLYSKMIESEYFNQYMALKERSYADDKKFVEKIIVETVLQYEELYDVLEELSVYWNDDVEFIISMILNTIAKFKETSTESKSLMPMFKDEEDEDFAKKLFRKATLNNSEHKKIIEEHLRNWDLERIAYLDVLIMELALCEFLYFPSIPTKVTLNEYIDLSKYYSTQKSQNFINGILDKILKNLKEEGKVIKAGRGLIGENE